MPKKQSIFSAVKKRFKIKKRLHSKGHLGVILEKESIVFAIPDFTKNKTIYRLLNFNYPENISYLSENFENFVFDCLQKIPKSLLSDIWIILPYDQIETRYIKIPKTSEKAAENSVYWTLKKEIEFDIKSYFLDFEKIETITERGIEKEGICAYIAEKSLIHKIRQIFENAGCRVSGITSVPFAVQTLLKNMNLKMGPKNICFVNPKKDSLEIYIFTNSHLKLVRQTKTGITSLGEALIMSSVENDDEELKWKTPEELTEIILDHIKNGSHKTRQYNKIDQGIEPAIDRMARQIERTVNYYKNQIEQESIDAVMVNGDLSGYHPLTDIISEYSTLNVFPAVDIVDETIISNHDQKILDRNEFLTSLGSLYCSNRHTPNILFTHRHEKALRIINFLNKSIIAASLCGLIICAGIFSLQKNEIKKLQEKKQNLQARLSNYSTELSTEVLTQTASKITANKQILKEKAGILEPGVLLNEFLNASSENIKIKDFKLDLTKEKREIVFSGYVFGKKYSQESILSGYILDLSSSELFLNVYVKSQEKIKLENETITAFSAIIKI
jgi:Tfp pilus assembly PilM family ATPase